MAFADKLRRLRREKDLTQHELARLTNVNPSSIGMYENGSRFPKRAPLLRIANFFKVSVDYLLDSEGQEEKGKAKMRTKLQVPTGKHLSDKSRAVENILFYLDGFTVAECEGILHNVMYHLRKASTVCVDGYIVED